MSRNRKHATFEPVMEVLQDEELALRVVEALRDHMARHTELELPGGPSKQPRENSETTAFSEVAMQAVIAQLRARPVVATTLHATLVITSPGDFVAVATTERNPVWGLEALVAGALSMRRALLQP